MHMTHEIKMSEAWVKYLGVRHESWHQNLTERKNGHSAELRQKINQQARGNFKLNTEPTTDYWCFMFMFYDILFVFFNPSSGCPGFRRWANLTPEPRLCPPGVARMPTLLIPLLFYWSYDRAPGAAGRQAHGSCAQWLSLAGGERHVRKFQSKYMYMYNWITMLYTWN